MRRPMRRQVSSSVSSTAGAKMSAALSSEGRTRGNDGFTARHIFNQLLMLVVLGIFFYQVFLSAASIFLKRDSTSADRGYILNILFSKPIIVIDTIGIITIFVFAIKYVLIFISRERRIKHIQNGHRLQHLIPYGCDPSVFELQQTTKTLPKVAMVLPVKFFRVKSASPKVMHAVIRLTDRLPA